MKTFVIENNWLSREFMDFGWGNGYVLIPEGHVLHGVHYNEIDVDVHYGLTFSELITEELISSFKNFISDSDIGSWIVGFDTAHYGDTLINWSKQDVENETERLKNQLINYKKV